MKKISSILTYLIPLFFLGCTVKSQTDQYKIESFSNEEKASYWYNNEAEINHYELKQARYGEMRDGHVVLVFVTEDLSNKRLVKLSPSSDEPKTNVLKMNYVKKFTTGIYDYSMMASVFSPMEPNSTSEVMRVTASSQEWCGHTFSSLDLIDQGYKVGVNSYFENEGDTSYTIKSTLSEDGVFNQIRVNPNNLPIGSINIIPSLFYGRLSHTFTKLEKASTALETLNGDTVQFTINYESIKRNVSIRFLNSFPYQITGWDDSYVSGWG